MFLPTTKTEAFALGWDELDIILVTGDSYIDSPFIGVAIIGKVLLNAGFRVGIIAQPATDSPHDITRLGEPKLFWGVTSGCVDSMIANYTATLKKRRSDDFTPGGQNTRRPDRALIVYSNLIRRYFKQTKSIVLGGIEASLRRIAHYDYWSNQIRRSVLLDAKADFLIYGMGERAVLALAAALKNQEDPLNIRGLCYISAVKKDDYLELPTFEMVSQDQQAFIEMFHLFYQNNDPLTAHGLIQPCTQRFLVQNPPAHYLSQQELDAVYDLDYARDQHPFYEQFGKVKALETIRFAITSHRGCYGECNFCAITVHQGRTVRWRSEQSILNEAQQFTKHPAFKGIILDVGGPTANMYGFECQPKLTAGACQHKRCLYPAICPQLKINHEKQIRLLEQLRNLPGIKKVFIASGVRPDLVLNDSKAGLRYLEILVKHHVSGQLKIAPEHVVPAVLQKMGKPNGKSIVAFREAFFKMTQALGKKQFLTYYFIAAHPGCTTAEMHHLKKFVQHQLRIQPEQVQIFLPAPSTYSSVMYYTECDPFTGEKMVVEKNLKQKTRQKWIVVAKKRPLRKR